MDEDLIQRAREGDAGAFRALVERYTLIAWRVACILIPDRGYAEDALQEAWIDVWRGLPRFDNSRPLRPWLLTIVANRCRMLARHHHLAVVALDDILSETMPDRCPPDMTSITGELEGALHDALGALPLEQRRLLALRYQAELDLVEIATLCGQPLSTVKSRLYRTLATLRKRLTTQPTMPAPTETTR